MSKRIFIVETRVSSPCDSSRVQALKPSEPFAEMWALPPESCEPNVFGEKWSGHVLVVPLDPSLDPIYGPPPTTFFSQISPSV
jgi:hypothetical protein